ncbi:MAG: hypothetical protein GX275_10340 [Clostridiales bacterium]|nr:hypothetical protein [Clostridiales bacterium]
MKIILIIIIGLMILINLGTFIYGKRNMNKLGKDIDNADENYNKGIKYMIISIVVSFLTIIIVSIIAILNVWA